MAYTSDAKQPNQIDFLKAHIEALEKKLSIAICALKKSASPDMYRLYPDGSCFAKEALKELTDE